MERISETRGHLIAESNSPQRFAALMRGLDRTLF
tara:strand:+ start:497 stop:598 length:102 start_codon:yes stop_codon:yes gene_type:complete